MAEQKQEDAFKAWERSFFDGWGWQMTEDQEFVARAAFQAGKAIADSELTALREQIERVKGEWLERHASVMRRHSGDSAFNAGIGNGIMGCFQDLAKLTRSVSVHQEEKEPEKS